MIETRLISVDGLSGSGKSTTAQWLEVQLQRRGIRARWVCEYDVPHPLWWYDTFDGQQYIVPPWDTTTGGERIEASVRKWRAFAASAAQSDDVYVIESFPLLNTIGQLLMGDAQPGQLLAHAQEIESLIASLHPAHIYFYQTDVAAALRRILDIRGMETERELIANMERFPYLRRRNLTGFDGVVALWKDIREMSDMIFAGYTASKLSIENSAGDWPHYRAQILEFLDTAPDETIVSEFDLRAFQGAYQLPGDGSWRYDIHLNDGRLTLTDQWGAVSALIPIGGHRFYREALPHVFHFVSGLERVS
jgi:hypothetical protein